MDEMALIFMYAISDRPADNAAITSKIRLITYIDPPTEARIEMVLSLFSGWWEKAV